MSTTHELATALLKAPERPFWDDLGIEGLLELKKIGETAMTTKTAQREKIIITKDQAIDAVDGIPPEGYIIQSNERTGKSSWHEIKQLVLKRESDGKMFADIYRLGLTENQESELWVHSEPNFNEVFPVEKIVIVYE